MTTTLALTVLPDEPFYEGGAVAGGVGGQWDCALAGRGYMIDWLSESFRHQSIQLIRAQGDGSSEVGEASLNPEDLWRRGAESWHGGAGQASFDLADSIRSRFRTSKGVMPWTRGEIALLQTTASKRASANANVMLAVAGSHLYALDGNELRYTTDITIVAPVFTNVAPAAGVLATPHSVVSDGYRVWAADGTDLYTTTRGGANYAAHHGAAWASSLCRYAKGRLFTAGTSGLATKHVLYQNSVTVASAVPAGPLFTHPNLDWTWTDIAEGPNAIYFSGYSGDKSMVYKTAIKADGTALDVPTVAAELPDGETVRAMVGYLGFLLLGTDKGVRFATLASDGTVDTIGALISVTAGVQCFEPQDRFVWFGWSNFDATSTGLGRTDLRTFNDSVPAYASDLMASGQGTVRSVVTFQTLRVFAVGAVGFYAETTEKEPTAYIESGLFGYGIPDNKTAINVTTRHALGSGSYTVTLAADRAGFTNLGALITTTASASGGTVVSAGPTRGEVFEIRLNINRDASATTSGPILTRWTLRSDPGAPSSKRIAVPLLLHRQVMQKHGVEKRIDVEFERAVLEDLRATRQVFQYQEGELAWSVVLDDFSWLPAHESRPIDGTFVAVLKTIVQ